MFTENPPVDKTLRKRKREENEEERTRKFFTRPDSVGALPSKCARGEDLDDKTSSEDDDDEEEEMPSEKFRRGISRIFCFSNNKFYLILIIFR